jgi:cell wall-associated NlpC family hydrolase
LIENWRQVVIDEARSWKRTPYVHKGRVKGVGVDCGGMIYEIFAPLLPLPSFPKDYPQDWAMHRESNELYLDFIMPFVKEVDQPVMGGITVFHFGRNFSHGAIVSEKKTFIHAYGRNDFGKVIESRAEFFYQGRKPRPQKHFDIDPKWLS